jgi:hypothetical protein
MMDKGMITVREHGLTFEGHVDDGKRMAEALAEVEDQTVSDFRFQLEVTYQAYYNLDQDDWGFANKEKNE